MVWGHYNMKSYIKGLQGYEGGESLFHIIACLHMLHAHMYFMCCKCACVVGVHMWKCCRCG